MSRKLGGGCASFLGRSWVPIQHSVVWVKAYLHARCHLDPSSSLATIDMGRKLGALPLLGEGVGSPSSTMSLGLRPASLPSGILIHPAIWAQQIWLKIGGGLCPFGGCRAWSLSDTMWPGARPTCMPGFILIHPTVWPHTPASQTGQDKQTDSGLIAWGVPFYKLLPKN